MALAIARARGAVARTVAAGADVAVLDRVPDAHQRLDRHVARRRLDQCRADVSGFRAGRLLYTDTALYIGMVYTYLPFMVLPVYARLAKLDATLLEAAADLGASPLRAFLRVTLPLSLPGIAAGVALVFIPCVGEYVIPELFGGPRRATDRPGDVGGVFLRTATGRWRRRWRGCC